MQSDTNSTRTFPLGLLSDPHFKHKLALKFLRNQDDIISCSYFSSCACVVLHYSSSYADALV